MHMLELFLHGAEAAVWIDIIHGSEYQVLVFRSSIVLYYKSANIAVL